MVKELQEELESAGFRIAFIARPHNILEEESALDAVPMGLEQGCSAVVARPVTFSTCIGNESFCPCDPGTVGKAYQPLLIKSVFHAFIENLPSFAQAILTDGNYHHILPGAFQGGVDAGSRFCVEPHPKKGRHMLILRTRESSCEAFVDGFFSGIADACPTLTYDVPFDQFVDIGAGAGQLSQSLAQNFFIIDDKLDTVITCSVSTAVTIASLFASSPKLPFIVLYGFNPEVSGLLDTGLLAVAVDPVLHYKGRGAVAKILELMKIRRWTHCQSAHVGDPPARGLLPSQIPTETVIQSRTAEEDVVRKALDGYSRQFPPRLSSLNLTVELQSASITAISASAGEVEALLLLNVQWKDPRLEFDHFLVRASPNEASHVVLEAGDVWTPLSQLNGIPQLYFASLMRLDAVTVEGVRVWSDGACSWRILYRTTFVCGFDIEAYPFDSHECELPDISLNRNFRMVPHLSNGTGSGFEYALSVPDNGGAWTSTWTIRFSRLGWYSHVSITAPSHLLCFVSFTSFWLPPTGVYDRSGLLVTTILAAIALGQYNDVGATTFLGNCMNCHIIFHFIAFAITVSSVKLEGRVQEMNEERDVKIQKLINQFETAKKISRKSWRATSLTQSGGTDTPASSTSPMPSPTPKSPFSQVVRRSISDKFSIDKISRKTASPERNKRGTLVREKSKKFLPKIVWADIMKYSVSFWGSADYTTKADLIGRRFVVPAFWFITWFLYGAFQFSPFAQVTYWDILSKSTELGLTDNFWYLRDPVLTSTVFVMLFYGIIAGITFLIYSKLDKKLEEIAEQTATMSTHEKDMATDFLKQFGRGKTRTVDEPAQPADELTSLPQPETAARDLVERVADADAAARDPTDAAGLKLDHPASQVESNDGASVLSNPNSIVII
jgi:hypothetical protein